MISPLWSLIGAASWTAAEYAIHRFVGHGKKRSPPKSRFGRFGLEGLAYEFNREHLAHHADPSYFAPTSRKVFAASVAIPALTAVLTPVLGLRRAGSFAVGFTAAYATYELLHRRVHTHVPQGRYARWVSEHHLLHHQKTPRANLGVTSPMWDVVFGTEKVGRASKEVSRSRSPRSQ